jgi:TrwC relaxase
MMTITKLRGAEYLLRSVADGVEDYFMGAGEAPGVWHGRWAAELGLTGVVEPERLRALVEGRHPDTGVDLLAGHRERKVKALDLTLSAPKSVSLLWAFGGDKVASEVSIAMVDGPGLHGTARCGGPPATPGGPPPGRHSWVGGRDVHASDQP